MEFIIARPEHLEDMWRITLDAKAQLKGLGLDQWQKGYPSREIWEQDFVNKTGILAVEDGKVLGYGFCMIKTHENDPVMTDRTELYIDDLCVDENCRGQHIGSAIYETICTYARQRRCHSVTLNVWCCNASAMKFYEKMGLKPQKIGMETIL